MYWYISRNNTYRWRKAGKIQVEVLVLDQEWQKWRYWGRKDTEEGTGRSRNGTNKDNCTDSKILTSSISLRLLLL